jgi:hypothetical protein
MNTKSIGLGAVVLAFCAANATLPQPSEAKVLAATEVSLTLIPPSPVTDQITLDIRAAVRNPRETAETVEVAVYLDKEKPANLLRREKLEMTGRSVREFSFRWATEGRAGKHRVILVRQSGSQTQRARQPIEILASHMRSTRRCLGGHLPPQ